MPVATANAFLEILGKSRLLPQGQLEQLRSSLGNLPDGKAAAIRLVKEGVLTRWQAGALLAGSTNLTIGKYQLLSQLATGTTGRVFLARHADMGRQVALKILPRRADASATNLQQFMEQARAVSALDHPNLIHTFDVDSEADQFYLVMEYFPGTDLQTLVEQEGPLDCRRAAEIIRQAAEGLAHAADKGMPHGDLRPSSLAVDRSGRVKVLHLGVVELAGVAMQMLDKKNPGSADYAAPEFTGRKATPSSDMYSLGCVFYFLLTGSPPFSEGTFEERRRQHQTVPPTAVTSRRTEVPAELAKICQKMMAKKPENRLTSAQEAATLLAAWLKENPALAPSADPADAAPAKPPVPAAREVPLKKAESLPDVGPKVPPKKPPVPAGAKPAAAPAPNAAAASAPKPAAASESKPPAAAAPSFDFSAKPAPAAKKPNAKAPAAKGPAPAVASEAAPEPAPKKKKKGAAKEEAKKPLDKRLVIGLGAGGGVALLVILGLVGFFVFGGGEDPGEQVAQAPAAAESDPDGINDEGLDEESLDGDLFSSSDDDDAEATEESADIEDPPVENADEAGNQLAAAATPVEAADSQIADSSAAPATSDSQAQPPPPSEESSSPPPAEPASPAPAEAKPPGEGAKPAESPAPAASPEPKPKPAPPKPKPKEPFAEFAQKTVSLPMLEGGETAAAALQPVTLGTVHDDPEAGVFLSLVGGDSAHDGRETFTLEADDVNFRNRAWTFYLGGESKTPLAKLTLNEQDNLTFQWTPESAELKAANYLRNCMMNIQIADKVKDIALRQPETVEPVAVSLAKPGGRPPQIELNYPPKEDALQLEITTLEGPFPNHTFEPQKTIKASKDSMRILFGDPPVQPLAMQVQSTLSRGKLSVTLSSFLNVNGQQMKLKPGDLEKAAAGAQAAYQQANNLVTAKRGPEGLLKQMEQNLPVMQAAALQYGDLVQKAGQLEGVGKIHFRVFYTVGQHQVELVTTGAPVQAPAK